MAGRSRKALKSRKPGGRLVQSLEDPRTGALARRARDAALSGMADPLWATPIGQMFMREDITQTQFDAASKYARLRAAADRAIGLPTRIPPALDLSFKRGGHGDLVERESDDVIIQTCYDAESAIGTASLPVVKRVVIYDQWPAGYQERQALFVGLDSLSRHWGLTPTGKSGHTYVRNEE